jgi:hypothetical protein
MTWQNEVENLFKKLKPVLREEKINQLWLDYQTRTDQRSRSEILGRLQVPASKYLDENYDRKVPSLNWTA